MVLLSIVTSNHVNRMTRQEISYEGRSYIRAPSPGESLGRKHLIENAAALCNFSSHRGLCYTTASYSALHEPTYCTAVVACLIDGGSKHMGPKS